MNRRDLLKALLVGAAGVVTGGRALRRIVEEGVSREPLPTDGQRVADAGDTEIVRRRLGSTDLEVSMFSFGAIKLPNIDEQEAADCLNLALDHGVNFIDTARNYRDSEEKIGKGIAHRRDEYYLATKSTARDAEGLEEELNTSLREMQTDYIDIYQLHTVSNQSAWEAVRAPGGAYEAALTAQEDGKIGHIGITVHRDRNVMREAITSGLFETIMLCYNPVDSEGVAAEILPLADEHDVGVIIMKALQGGALCPPEEARVEGLGGPDAVIAGSMRFVLGDPYVDTMLVGMEATEQVENNIAVAKAFEPLTDEERRELFDLIGELRPAMRYDQTCLRCGYCLPCPVEIDIPEALRAADMKRAYADDLQHIADEAWDDLEVHPEACIDCGVCKDRCPAGLEIPELLQEAVALFEE